VMQKKATLWQATSKDRGQTWSKPVNMKFGSDVSSKGKPPGLFLKHSVVVVGPSESPTWLLPIYNMKDLDRQYSMILFSSDKGNTWKELTIDGTTDLVQPSLVLSPDSTQMQVYLRDRNKRHVYRVVVSGGGHEGFTSPRDIEWSKSDATDFPNADNTVEAHWLSNGKQLLVFDDSDDREERYPLKVALSDDQGRSFPNTAVLEDVDTSPLSRGASLLELSYPSSFQTPDGALHIAFTFNRETIKYVKLNENWILNGSV